MNDVTKSDLLTFLSADDLDAMQPRLEAIYAARYTRNDNDSVADERLNNLQNLFRSRVFRSFSALLPKETQADQARLNDIADKIAAKYAGEFAQVFTQSYSREAREGRVSEQALRRRALQNLVQEIVKQQTPISH